MSDESFRVELAGRAWDVPHLPFRVIKAVQPALFAVYRAAGAGEMTSDSIAALDEAELEKLAEATWRAVAYVEPALTLADFLDLPFSVKDLIAAFPAVAKAAGLQAGTRAPAGAAPEKGKSTGTASSRS